MKGEVINELTVFLMPILEAAHGNDHFELSWPEGGPWDQGQTPFGKPFDSSTQRKKSSKTVSEIIHCYYRFINKRKALCAGKNPDCIKSKKAITKREWHSSLNKARKKNPFLEAQVYLDYLNSDPSFLYRDVAENFEVSKARVSQMIALNKLPQEILDYFQKGGMLLTQPHTISCIYHL